ncbi:collagen-like protein [Candidatus Peregrinibacteria bacterium]|nr:collagen-like protein [Candidatus Peregrinibacteria bacterium]
MSATVQKVFMSIGIAVVGGFLLVPHAHVFLNWNRDSDQDTSIVAAQKAGDDAQATANTAVDNTVVLDTQVQSLRTDLIATNDAVLVQQGKITALRGDVDALGTRITKLQGKVNVNARAIGAVNTRIDTLPKPATAGDVATVLKSDPDFVRSTTGLRGFTGAVGPQGSQGDTGATGLQGPRGYTGATGATGLQGPRGYTGATGATGLQGSNGADGVTRHYQYYPAVRSHCW